MTSRGWELVDVGLPLWTPSVMSTILFLWRCESRLYFNHLCTALILKKLCLLEEWTAVLRHTAQHGESIKAGCTAFIRNEVIFVKCSDGR